MWNGSQDEKRQMKEDIERRRMEAAERRMKSLNMSSLDGDESFPLSPKSPTFKVNNNSTVGSPDYLYAYYGIIVYILA